MKVRFLDSTTRDLAWFRQYYRDAFSEGEIGAKRAYFAAKRLLSEHPHAGVRIEDTDLREVRLGRTPFTFVYRVTRDEIQILRVWDARRQRPDRWT